MSCTGLQTSTRHGHRQLPEFVLTKFVSPDDKYDLHRKKLCVTLVIYQESLYEARSTKYKILKCICLLLSKYFWIHISKNPYQSGSNSICTNVFLLRRSWVTIRDGFLLDDCVDRHLCISLKYTYIYAARSKVQITVQIVKNQTRFKVMSCYILGKTRQHRQNWWFYIM